MKRKHFPGVLLLAPVVALMLAAMPLSAEADPPFGRGGPPGLSGKSGFPPGTQKFGRGGFCPPGLQDKGCVPPGLQRGGHRDDRFRNFRRRDVFRDFRRDDDFRDFRPSDRIPNFWSFEPLPYREYGLPAPGPGRRYIRRGEEAYLISEGTHRIIEAIRLFEALAE